MWLFVPFGQIEAEVPEVLESDRLGILGELGLERGVTARAAATGNMVAALFVLGQREQRLGERPGAVDQALTDAVIGDDREAEALERAAERRSEPIRVARLIGEAECRNMGGGGIEHGHPIRVRETNHYRCPP